MTTEDNNDTLLGQGPAEKGAPIKGTKLGTSGAKGFVEGTGKTLAVSFTKEGIQQLLTALEKVKTNDRGAKLSIHYGNKQTQNGTQFVSSFMFVGEIGEPISGGSSVGQRKVRAVAANVPTEL